MDVVAELARCATTADRYRLQIEAENELSPAEIDALHARAAGLPDASRDWVDKLAAMCRRIRDPIQPFRRRALAPEVSFFEGSAPPGAPRALVVAFAGVAKRMMLPLGPFLQGLPADRCDVLVLRDPDRLAFLAGLPGYAADLPALAARIATDLPMARYSGAACIGASSGGAAALAFGPLIGAGVAVSLGGLHPRGMPLRHAATPIDRYVFDALRAGTPKAATRLVCAHGEDFLRDCVRSRLLAMTVPGSEVLVVRGVALHGVVAGLFQRNALARFLEEVLLDGTLPADGAWQP
ncbi:hypothetical protein [Roseomonas sp. CECT 9278]|uniref:hypothetical protein n=1 Tax=Roseomonas sp. CECT 9278 TaxID=2845823 RepID=UPI001E5FA6BC|nr:hypothetical protein [Roseomonas sp. CECT 9278]CAH0252703.1 hypothetical protein ROS9278_03188 [Roseomonas sp. CECT 9278]